MNESTILTNQEKDHLQKLNAKNHYGFSKFMLLCLITKHEKAKKNGDAHTMAAIEYRLTDANFHSECCYLAAGDYDELRTNVRCLKV